MAEKQNLTVSLIALGIVAVVGGITGLGLAGAFGSGETSPQGVRGPAVTPTPAPTPEPSDSPGDGPAVAPDPDFREALASARFSIRGWETDFSRHSVPFSEIFSGGPGRDGIPP